MEVERLDEEAIPRLAEKRVCVFFVSTTGDGELPDHSKPWWRALLRRDLPRTALSHLQFAVFGLGDSSYIRFNAAARKVAARLPQLGAVPLCERGLGDEQSEPGGLDQDYDAWVKNQLFPSLDKLRNGSDDCPRQLLSKGRGGGGEEEEEEEEGTKKTNKKRFLQRSDDEGIAKPIPMPGKLKCRYSVTLLPPEASVSAAAGGGTDDALLPPVIAAPTAGLYSGSTGAGGTNESASVGPWPAKVTSNARLTASGWRQDVRQVTLDYSHVGVSSESTSSPAPFFVPFRPGDVALVYPRNRGTASSDEAVKCFADYLGLPLDARIEIKIKVESSSAATEEEEEESDSPLVPFPSSPITLRQLLECCLDVQGIPRRSFLEQAAVFCSDDEQAEKLLEMSGYLSSETGEEGSYGSGLYRLYVLKEARTYSEVLRDFSSCKIPLQNLLEMIPPIKPRHFSIASSSVVAVAATEAAGISSNSTANIIRRSSLDLCVGLVEYQTPLKRSKVGVCSGFLGSLKPGDTVWLQIRKGSWMPPWPMPAQQGEEAAVAEDQLTAGLSVPLLLVGPGTGVAPMRAIWQERQAALTLLLRLQQGSGGSGNSSDSASSSSSPSSSSSSSAFEPAPCWLFYGCRNATKDWLYADEVAGPLAPLSLTHVDAAFSRPSEDPAHATPPPASTATSTTSADAATPSTSAPDSTAAEKKEDELAVSATATTTVTLDDAAVRRRSDLMYLCRSSSSSSSSSASSASAASFELATPFRMRANAAVTYVQKRIAAHAGELKGILLDNPSSLVFVSGSAKRMPSDVIGEIKEAVLMKEAGMTEDEAKKTVSAMEARRRLVVEAWS